MTNGASGEAVPPRVAISCASLTCPARPRAGAGPRVITVAQAVDSSRQQETALAQAQAAALTRAHLRPGSGPAPLPDAQAATCAREVKPSFSRMLAKLGFTSRAQ